MRNLAELVLDRAARRPGIRFGTVESPLPLALAIARARDGAARMLAAGLLPAGRAALVGETSTAYLLAWLALHLAGIEVALINPALPRDLLADMLAELQADAVVWVGQEAVTSTAPTAQHLDASQLTEGVILRGHAVLPSRANDTQPPGLSRSPEAVAGYMHTSGTTGAPKLCAQTHTYFLRLGRFIADALAITPADTIFAPLPMFHINPLGYGVVGGLTGGADVLGTAKFSASRFWPAVRGMGATVVFLHAPPVEILKKATTAQQAAGHILRCAFYADAEFLERFQVPTGYSCYGSTEAGGLCHIWTWHKGDRCPHPEGMGRYAGSPRHDVDWDLSEDGEILVRGRQANVLCSGYRTRAGLQPLEAADGWFHTGDLGRRDEDGRLIFIERRAESIRVRGEYVPISFVERTFAEIPAVEEAALWRRASPLADHEAVLYVVASDGLPLDAIRRTAAALPPYMRPAAVVRLQTMPRLAGVGKINRRLLPASEVCECYELSGLEDEQVPSNERPTAER
jgi:acyl-CoA synthetase (AMP-forming)/AMP-acid ligase II